MNEQKLELLKKRSDALLVAMVGKELAVKWWDSPNRAFDGQKPSDRWEHDPVEVYQYLMRSAEGEW